MTKIRSQENHEMTEKMEYNDDNHGEIPDPDDEIDLGIDNVDGEGAHTRGVTNISTVANIAHGTSNN